MIIEVKAARGAGADRDPAERYVATADQRRSRTPFVFGGGLMAAVLYLKAALAPRGPEAPNAGPAPVPEPGPKAPAEPALVEASAEPAAEPPAEPSAAATAPGPAPTQAAFAGEGGEVLALAAFRGRPGPAAETAPVGSGGVAARFGLVPDAMPGGGPIGKRMAPDTGVTAARAPARPDEEDPDDDDDDDRDNRAPRVGGPVFLAELTACGLLAITLEDLLATASDPDGDVLAVQAVRTSQGEMVASADGWLFRPDGAEPGTVAIEYRISDGALAVAQVAYVEIVRPAPIRGGDGDDVLLGTDCGDEIDGGAGDDDIDARGGRDVVLGGAGDDHVVAGTGDDSVWGGDGDDIVFGGDGADHLFGGAGRDRLSGDAGDDVLQGGAGGDTLAGGAGDDLLSGEAGDDLLADGPGADVVSGGAGDDRLVAAADAAPDVFDGGTGRDALHLPAAGRVAVDLGTGRAAGAAIGPAAVRDVEIVVAGGGDDTLAGAAADEALVGGGGDDWLAGRGGDDRLHGGDGGDTLFGGAGDDLLAGGGGDDRIADGTGADRVQGGDGDDQVVAAADAAADGFDGGAGMDTLDLSAVAQGVCVDLVAGTVGGLEAGADTIAGFERVLGGAGDDHFVAGPQAVTLAGGGGQNLFEFRPDDGAHGPAAAIHEILDFRLGDRIRLSKYDLFERAVERFEDRFGTVYGETAAEGPRIRWRHDAVDAQTSRTTVEADFDGDDTFETTILLGGHHPLTIVETG
jgi:Ca2+-binding RTX toxin-like protein